MDAIINEKTNNGKSSEVGGMDLYRDSIKKALATAIGTAIDEETLRVTKEMEGIRENAIKMISEEQRNVIQKIIEDEKKSIWTKAFEAQQSEGFNSTVTRDNLVQSVLADKPAENGKNGHTPIVEADQAPAATAATAPAAAATPAPAAAVPTAAPAPAPIPFHVPVYEEKLELEILPPRDQNEIESIHAYLKTMREVQEVELLTLVDKSLFKVTLNHPVDFMEKLGQLPQVHNAEEVRENGKKKIKIALAAKSKLERNHNEVNDKVNKIFNRKK
jgi:hypothetical protein